MFHTANDMLSFCGVLKIYCVQTNEISVIVCVGILKERKQCLFLLILNSIFKNATQYTQGVTIGEVVRRKKRNNHVHKSFKESRR